MNQMLGAPVQPERFVIQPFNGTFFLVLGIHVVILVLLALFFRKKSEKTRRTAVVVIYLLGILLFVVYKIFLSRDTAYSEICAAAGKGGFTWWAELPLQLCNINLIMIPAAVLTMKRNLLSFAFFVAPLGALFALVMPGIGFERYSFFLPRIAGYYITHFMVFLGGPALAAFDLYRPRFKDTIPTALTLLAVTFLIFLINELLRVTGANPYSNYFFTNMTEGNAILEFCWSLIPVPFLYEIPLLLILVPFCLIVTSCFRLSEKIGKTRSA